MRSTSRWSGVRCSSVRPSRRATLPISVAMPVAVTTARPRPRVDRGAAEDHVHAGRRAPTGAASGATSFSTASLSPVSDASATVSDAASTSRRVGADRVALGEHQHVARHDLGGRDPLLAPVAHDARRRRRHPLQRRHRLLGPRLLHVAEHGVERRRSPRSRSRRTGTPSAPSSDPRDQRDDHRGEQQVDQRVGELREELAPRGHGRRRLELVRPVPLEPGGRLGRAQSPVERRCRARPRPRPRHGATARSRRVRLYADPLDARAYACRSPVLRWMFGASERVPLIPRRFAMVRERSEFVTQVRLPQRKREARSAGVVIPS